MKVFEKPSCKNAVHAHFIYCIYKLKLKIFRRTVIKTKNKSLNQIVFSNCTKILLRTVMKAKNE